jgi:hypothetical protein
MQKKTLQQHHQKVAEHDEQAPKHHKKPPGSENPATTKLPHTTHTAHGHSVQATEQETEVSKKYANTQGLQK